MNYPMILAWAKSQIWAVDPMTLCTIREVLAARFAGERWDKEEVESRIDAAGGRRIPRPGVKGVGVLPVMGLISHRAGFLDDSSGGTSTEALSGGLRNWVQNDEVGSIVLDVNSPGGSVSGITELAKEIREARTVKPIIAAVNASAHSAAYWLASQATEVVATPSAVLGSIGAYSLHTDESKALEKAGISVDVIKSGKEKAAGLVGPLPPEARARVQKLVEDSRQTFLEDVALGRSSTPAAVQKNYGEGAFYSAKDALKLGAIDRIEPFKETLARAAAGKVVNLSQLKASGVARQRLALSRMVW